MKSRTRLILLGVTGFAVSLVSLLPASIAIQMAGVNSKDVQLIKPSGTIWNGEAQSLLMMRQEFNSVEWQVNPLSLLGGSGNVDVRSNDDDYPLTGNISLGMNGDVDAENLRGILPASMLGQFRAMALVSLDGKLGIKIKDLLIENQAISSVNGEIVLNQGRLTAPVNTALGDIKLVLSEQKGNVRVDIKDQGAPIGIEGTLILRPGNKMSFNALLSPGANADQFLMTMLKNVATPQSDGRLKVQYDGVY